MRRVGFLANGARRFTPLQLPQAGAHEIIRSRPPVRELKRTEARAPPDKLVRGGETAILWALHLLP